MAETQQTAATDAAHPVPCAPSSMMTRLMSLGVASGIVLFIGGIILAIGESGDFKLKLFQAMAFPFSVIVGATLVSLGFASGKLFEGVVPAGFKPALQAMATAAGLPPTVATPLINAVLVPAVPTPAADTATVQANTAATQANTAAMKQEAAAPIPHAMSLLLPLLLAGMLFAGGCVSTSAAYKNTIGAGIDNVVQDMHGYTAGADWDLNHNGAIDPPEAAAKAKEIADTDAMAASVADKAKITVEGVEAPWKEVEPAYRRYIAGDRNLLTDEDRKIRTDTADAINRLNELEKARQKTLWAWFGVEK